MTPQEINDFALALPEVTEEEAFGLDGSVPSDEVCDMVKHAYHRVVASLPKHVRTRLAGQL
jgi:hypothetical protein